MNAEQTTVMPQDELVQALEHDRLRRLAERLKAQGPLYPIHAQAGPVTPLPREPSMDQTIAGEPDRTLRPHDVRVLRLRPGERAGLIWEYGDHAYEHWVGEQELRVPTAHPVAQPPLPIEVKAPVPEAPLPTIDDEDVISLHDSRTSQQHTLDYRAQRLELAGSFMNTLVGAFAMGQVWKETNVGMPVVEHSRKWARVALSLADALMDEAGK